MLLICVPLSACVGVNDMYLYAKYALPNIVDIARILLKGLYAINNSPRQVHENANATKYLIIGALLRIICANISFLN